MTAEQIIAKHIVDITYDDLSQEAVSVVKKQLLACFGGIIAGWNSDGCRTCAELVKETGGAKEATFLVWNGKVPAQQAAFANSVMGRALDICDHIAPGVHIGSACIPAALAAAELAGGCTGRDLILAVAVGTELALRLNPAEADYDGFDPTGVDAMFESAAAAAKLMKLNENQTMHALALAFNRCGGSFQSNIDGSLAVHVIEGWVAQNGVECAKLASRGITDPKNFLEGVYGYYHIFGRDHISSDTVLKDFGKEWHLNTLGFKKYPSCGQTQGGTDMIVNLMTTHGFKAGHIDKIKLMINPFTAKLVGKPFELGENPKVDAQFNVGYCVANAAVRYPVQLIHFEPEYIDNKEVIDFLHEHVEVVVVPELHERGHYSCAMEVRLKDGTLYSDSNDVPPGTFGNELKAQDFESRFHDCIAFGGRSEFRERSAAIYEAINNFEKIVKIDDFIILFKGDC